MRALLALTLRFFLLQAPRTKQSPAELQQQRLKELMKRSPVEVICLTGMQIVGKTD